MFLWLVCFFFVLWIAIFWFRRRRMYRLASAIQGPDEELPMIGIAHTLTGSTEDIMTELQKFSYLAMKSDGIIRGWLGHILYLLVVDPLDLEMVLKTCLEKDDLHRFMRKIIGNGVIFAPVTIWRKRRKILIPAFSPKIIDNFVEVFSEQSEKLTVQLKEVEGCGQVSVWRFLSTYTLDAVCETVMGVKINAQENPNAPFLRAMKFILNLVTERIFCLWLQPDWLYKFFPQYSKHQKYGKVMIDFTDEVIHHKREDLKKEKSYQSEVDHEYDLGNYKRQSFLDLLINLSGGEKGYSDKELREEVLTLTIAGTDTSAVAVGFTLKLLAKYPKVQDRVFQELQEVFGDSDGPLVKEDLINLKYLERVVKESLRLFPPAPFIIRKVLEDVTLPSGRVLPAGSGVVVSIWGIHRDPKYWGPDAECFDPDRFLPERFNLQHACSYMPFSIGPRNCVGYQYAQMSVKIALSAIVRRYKIVGDEESGPVPFIKTKLDVMMKAVDDYKIGLEKRTLT
ncbi:unnamed protein product [Parnassius mnemosyne]|uniref:Cytochrome P450 n=1 Tax=Parnassius mnemosyne TaxID=213953 RepID=A0AAV1MBI5_9NEOP